MPRRKRRDSCSTTPIRHAGEAANAPSTSYMTGPALHRLRECRGARVVVGTRIAIWSTRASTAGGSTAARARRPAVPAARGHRRDAAQPLRPHALSAFADGEANNRADARSFCCAAPAAPACSASAPGTWTGDINNTFATLEAQVASGLNVGMSGVPLLGHGYRRLLSDRGRRAASSSRAGSSSARSARSSARTAARGASACRGPTAPRSRRSAGTISSSATG